MSIRGKIKAAALAHAGGETVTDVRIGLGYTAVRLADGRVGAAYTFRKEEGSGCTIFAALRPLAGRPAADLVRLFDSIDRISSAVALATANALCNTQDGKLLKGDILDHLQITGEDRVAMIGHFMPLVPAIKRQAAELLIFDENADPAAGELPPAAIGDLLPNCTVALVTGTSIINDTVDGILSYADNCREVVVLGASTPLILDAFAGTPVTLLSGIHVADPDAFLQIVSEGGGMRIFKKCIQKVNVRV